MRCHSVGCGFPDNSTQSRTAPWDRTIVRLSLCPLLRAVDSEGAQVTSAVADLVAGLSGSASSRSVMSASATRDVLRHLQVPNFAALLLSLFHFRRSFLVVHSRQVMRKVRPEVTRKLGFRSFVLLSCLAFRCVLAITRRSLPRRAQAMEGEAEKL
jgi:hypothetical protein